MMCETMLGLDNIKFFDVRKDPFDLYGFYHAKEGERFGRLPEDVAKNKEGIFDLSYNTAGGRVRFCTNSEYVAVKAKMRAITPKPHMPLCGSSGFDLYSGGEKQVFSGLFKPPLDMTDGYEAVVHFETREQRYFTVNFPSYNDVEALYIGIEDTAQLAGGAKYKHERPVVFYGSSITQGACASRPGNAYPAVLSRRLDCDYIDLGFAGNAKGDKFLVDYMAGLDMSVFVCDYDHNASSSAFLADTLPYIYQKIRRENPALPFVFISRPNYHADKDEDVRRREVIIKNWESAKNAGDSAVFFVDGAKFFGDFEREDCTVDGTHPNDLGFRKMADGIYPVLKSIFEVGRYA